MRENSVTISAGTIFKAVLILGLVGLLYYLRDLILILLTAVVIASAIEPMTSLFVRYKIPRVLSVIFIYLFFAFLITAVFYLFLPFLLNDMAEFLTALPYFIESIQLGGAINGFGEQNILGGFGEIFSLKDTVVSLQDALVGTSGGVLQSISSIFGGLVSFILIIVISFYLAVQEKGIEKFLKLITPLKHEKYVINLWERSQKKIGLWMQGQLLLGLIVGVLVFLGLTILQVKYALLLAVLAALFEIIPLFGPILAATPAVILGFVDSISLGLMVLGLYVIIQQFENHLIYPLVVRKVVGVSPILVIIALIVGAKLAGFLGLLLAVPIAAALTEFLDDTQREKYALTQKNAN